jgi:N-hydroxyarylamine O-acetyltransferase
VNTNSYLKRIDYTGSLEPSAATLRDLQVTHLQTVPFENLSIHSNEPVVLEDDALFSKIVERRRGGFCYELNGLFAALLRTLGFDVAMLAAGVANAQGGFGPKFDHMALMVSLDQRWLVDVGFGDSFTEPLLLDEREVQTQGTDAFRIVAEDADLVLMRRKDGEAWIPQYRFDLQPHNYFDYQDMCNYHQTSPDSHFTKARLCSRATANGRITLSDMRFITTSGDLRDERTLTNQEEFNTLLRDQFGIVMSDMR